MVDDRKLNILRLRAAYYESQNALGLFGPDIPLIDFISLGHLEGRPVDISSLSSASRIPRPTVRRHVNRLSDAGWIVTRRRGRHTYVYLTDEGLSRILDNLEVALLRTRAKFAAPEANIC